MLDYAANAEAYWRAGTVAEAYAVTADQSGLDPNVTLVEFLGDRDPAEFWDQVDSNFRAGKVRLVFVADVIPKELVRIVEYLNDHMDIEIRAIELNWFESSDGRTSLAPKVLGHTTRSAAQKAGSSSLSPIARDEWIERSLTPFGDKVASAARELVQFIDNNDGEADVTSTQGSIFVRFSDTDGSEFYPFYISRSAKGRIYFNLYLLLKQPALADERARKIVYDELVSIVGPLSTATLDGSPGFQLSG